MSYRSFVLVSNSSFKVEIIPIENGIYIIIKLTDRFPYVTRIYHNFQLDTEIIEYLIENWIYFKWFLYYNNTNDLIELNDYKHSEYEERIPILFPLENENLIKWKTFYEYNKNIEIIYNKSLQRIDIYYEIEGYSIGTLYQKCDNIDEIIEYINKNWKSIRWNESEHDKRNPFSEEFYGNHEYMKYMFNDDWRIDFGQFWGAYGLHWYVTILNRKDGRYHGAQITLGKMETIDIIELIKDKWSILQWKLGCGCKVDSMCPEFPFSD